MSQQQPRKFLSLIPEHHQTAIITDDPVTSAVVDSAPQSPEAQPIDKTRRSSSNVSAASVPGDQISDLQGKQFLKLSH